MDFENYIISHKALRLMQNLFSLPEINKYIFLLNKEYGNNFYSGTKYFSTLDFYPAVYEESLSLIIELAILMRRKIEECEQYGGKYDISQIKFSNVGKYCDTHKDISFRSGLSKIIHSDSIVFELDALNSCPGYDNVVGFDCVFSDNVLITGREKDGSPYNAVIDWKKLCINALMMESWIYH